MSGYEGPWAEETEPAEENQSAGGLTSMSKKLGDGFWCPVCFENGRYTWLNARLSFLHEMVAGTGCGECDTTYRRMDIEKIKKLMKNH